MLLFLAEITLKLQKSKFPQWSEREKKNIRKCTSKVLKICCFLEGDKGSGWRRNTMMLCSKQISEGGGVAVDKSTDVPGFPVFSCWSEER